jgi:hypothetical protein
MRIIRVVLVQLELTGRFLRCALEGFRGRVQSKGTSRFGRTGLRPPVAFAGAIMLVEMQTANKTRSMAGSNRAALQMISMRGSMGSQVVEARRFETVSAS